MKPFPQLQRGPGIFPCHGESHIAAVQGNRFVQSPVAAAAIAPHSACHTVIDAHPRIGGKGSPGPFVKGYCRCVQPPKALLGQILHLRRMGAGKPVGLCPHQPQIPGAKRRKGIRVPLTHPARQLRAAPFFKIPGHPDTSRQGVYCIAPSAVFSL